MTSAHSSILYLLADKSPSLIDSYTALKINEEPSIARGHSQIDNALLRLWRALSLRSPGGSGAISFETGLDYGGHLLRISRRSHFQRSLFKQKRILKSSGLGNSHGQRIKRKRLLLSRHRHRLFREPDRLFSVGVVSKRETDREVAESGIRTRLELHRRRECRSPFRKIALTFEHQTETEIRSGIFRIAFDRFAEVVGRIVRLSFQ